MSGYSTALRLEEVERRDLSDDDSIKLPRWVIDARIFVSENAKLGEAFFANDSSSFIGTVHTRVVPDYPVLLKYVHNFV